VIVGVVLTLLVSYLATAGVLNGVTPSEISDALLTQFTPANCAFAITSWGERLWVHVPFSLYLGWIAVATIANAASPLVYHGWSAFGVSDSLWSAIMILITVLVGAAALWRRANAVYAAVYVWAVFAKPSKTHSKSLSCSQYSGIFGRSGRQDEFWNQFSCSLWKTGGKTPLDS
jgi:hypothetical protein